VLQKWLLERASAQSLLCRSGRASRGVRKSGRALVAVSLAESRHGPSKAINYPCEIRLSKRGPNWFKDVGSRHFEIGISRGAAGAELFEGIANATHSIFQLFRPYVSRYRL